MFRLGQNNLSICEDNWLLIDFQNSQEYIKISEVVRLKIVHHKEEEIPKRVDKKLEEHWMLYLTFKSGPIIDLAFADLESLELVSKAILAHQKSLITC